MESLHTVIFWVILGYLLGSVPFSALVLRKMRGVDFRHIGDGNPGAANAWKVGGWQIGMPALLLDYLKGAIPVTLAHFVFAIDGWGLAAIAVAPVMGHACSIFLRFKGGKALAVTFGIWTGLTLWEAPVILGALFVLGILLVKGHAWVVIFGMLGLLLYLLLRDADPILLTAWSADMAILTWKHWSELGTLPRLQFRPLRHP